MAIEFAGMLQGVTSTQLKTQWDSLTPITRMVDKLRNRRILLVTGDQDDFFRTSHYDQFLKEMPEVKWMRFSAGDHFFSACRKQLVGTVTKWLNSLS